MSTGTEGLSPEQREFIDACVNEKKMLVIDGDDVCLFIAGKWAQILDIPDQHRVRAVRFETTTHYCILLRFVGTADDGYLCGLCNRRFWSEAKADVELTGFLRGMRCTDKNN